MPFFFVEIFRKGLSSVWIQKNVTTVASIFLEAKHPDD